MKTLSETEGQPNGRDARDQLRRLLARVYDCEAGNPEDADAARTQLATLLAEHPDLVDDYCLSVSVETALGLGSTQSQLESLRGKQPEQAAASLESRGAESEERDQPRAASPKTAPASLDSVTVSPRRDLGRSKPRPQNLTLRAGALPRLVREYWQPAAVAAGVLIAVFGVYQVRRGPDATFVALEDTVWNDGIERSVGDRLGSDWINLEAGVARIALRSGAKASISAPAHFRIMSGNSAQLSVGKLSAWTPPGAEGFAVQTPSLNVVDLGTAFQVAVGLDDGQTVHVTEGVVWVEAEDTETQLTAGQVLVGGGGFSPSVLDPSSLVPETTGAMLFTAEHPQSLGLNRFDHDDQIHVFLESFRNQLGHDLRVDVANTGRHTVFGPEGGNLKAGVVFHCYLVHFSPLQRRQVVEGSVTFPGKILGVLTDSDRLNGSNPILGSDWTLQCFHPQRGLESTPDRNSDILKISSDGRTLSATMRTEAIDQVRVLVAADEQPVDLARIGQRRLVSQARSGRR